MDKRKHIRHEEIKGFNIDVYYNDESLFNIYLIATFPNKEIVFDFVRHCNTCEIDINEAVDKYIKEASKRLFTDEDILSSPVDSIEEYNVKMYFLENYYLNQIGFKYNWCGVNEGEVYDPVSLCFLGKEHEELVKHHIMLYAHLKEALRPTIFAIPQPWMSEYEKFMAYISCLPYAKSTDPYLSTAMEYIKNHARSMTKYIYEKHGCTDTVLYLVNNGYIKKPTMRKLLEMSNDKGDAQFSAFLLELLKDTKASKSRFSL